MFTVRFYIMSCHQRDVFKFKGEVCNFFYFLRTHLYMPTKQLWGGTACLSDQWQMEVFEKPVWNDTLRFKLSICVSPPRPSSAIHTWLPWLEQVERDREGEEEEGGATIEDEEDCGPLVACPGTSLTWQQ